MRSGATFDALRWTAWQHRLLKGGIKKETSEMVYFGNRGTCRLLQRTKRKMQTLWVNVRFHFSLSDEVRTAGARGAATLDSSPAPAQPSGEELSSPRGAEARTTAASRCTKRWGEKITVSSYLWVNFILAIILYLNRFTFLSSSVLLYIHPSFFITLLVSRSVPALGKCHSNSILSTLYDIAVGFRWNTL